MYVLQPSGEDFPWNITEMAERSLVSRKVIKCDWSKTYAEVLETVDPPTYASAAMQSCGSFFYISY